MENERKNSNPTSTMKPYLKLIRVHHWIKNFLIFLPLIFSGQLLDGSLLVAVKK